MLSYKYKHIFDSTIQSCKDCKNYIHCRYDSRKIKNEFGPCIEGVFEYKHPEVTNNNAEWIFFQIRRQTSNYKIIAEGIIQDHRLNWQKPDSLKDNMNGKPTVLECCAFRTALGATNKFLKEKKVELALMKYDKEEYTKRFVNSFIDTEIVVKGKEVSVKSWNEPFIDFLRKAVQQENYSFVVDKTFKEKENKNERSCIRKRIKKVA